MFKTYLKIAYRNLFKNKTYSFLNITGLAIGLTCFFLISLWVKNELSYDKFHNNADNIYRLVNRVTTESEVFHQAVTSPPMGPNLKNEFPEVLDFVRLAPRAAMVQYENKIFRESNLLLVDSSFFKIFGFRLLKGDPETALAEPYTLVLTEDFAKKYFGDENPVGKTMVLDYETNFKVTGVMENVPKNSHFTFDYLGSFRTWEEIISNPAETWFWNGFYTYLLLPENFNYKNLEEKLDDFANKHFGKHQEEYRMFYHYYLQPLKDVYLQSDLRYEIEPTSNMSSVYIFSTVGIFILLIGCINYMNIATARSVKRAKEVGVSKVLGAFRSQLIKQHLTESLILTFIALLFALVLIEIIMPSFKNLTGKEIEFFYSDSIFIYLFLISAAVGILSGLYPAFVISGYKPSTVLKGSFHTGYKGTFIRKSLVVFQFTISIILIAGIIIINEQMNFIKDKDLGYNKDNLLIINSYNSKYVKDSFDVLKEKFLQHKSIDGVSRSGSIITGNLSNSHAVTVDSKDKPITTSIYWVAADYDYGDVYKIKLIAGRFFDKSYSTDSLEAIIINEVAVKNFGWNNSEEAIGKPFKIWQKEGRVIGVVQDFAFSSLQNRIEPAVITMLGSSYSFISVRLKNENLSSTISFIEDTWKDVVPEVPLNLTFMDDRVQAQYESEKRFADVFLVFSILSIFIACLGLFGLATFAAEQRTKEIGIRKVLGASVSSVVVLISKDFLKLIVIAGIISIPAAYFLMNEWLKEFAYRIDINAVVFLLTFITALIIAMFTISFKAISAANSNPVKSLRYE